MRSCLVRFLLGAFFAGALCCRLPAADVVPDGGTATSVVTNAAGRTQVNIAPVFASGISHNTYTTFNVPTNGVDLNNQTVGAATILNEVTSSNPSLIEGAITVLGPQAHVILANPNGITVNGGSFINVGGVALSTGKVSFVTINPTPAITQTNLVLTNGQPGEGIITIGPNGLTGTITFLDLLSRAIQVNGNITNANNSPNALLQLVAGKSITEFDSSVSPADDTRPWNVSQPNGGSNPGAIEVDITRPSALSASRILIAVTDQGAGVRHAGTALASAGDFILTANGEVQINGGKIQAANNVVIQRTDAAAGTPLTLHGTPDTTGYFSIQAGGEIDLLADGISLDEGQLTTGYGDITLGRSGVAAVAPLLLTGTPGNSFLNSGAGLGLFAQGQDISLTAVNVTASNAAQIVGNNFTLSGVAQGSAWSPALLEAAQINLAATGAVQVLGSDILAGTDIVISGTRLSALAEPSNGSYRKAQINAANGGLLITTTAGGLNNQGSLLQGNVRIAGNAASLGGVTLALAGDLTNYSLDATTLALIFAQGDDLVIHTPGNVTNDTGRFIANGNVILQAAGTLANQVDHVDVANQGVVQTSERRVSGLFFFFSRIIKDIKLDYGDLRIANQLAYIIGGKGVTLQVGSLTNDGGEIDANGGDIVVNSAGAVLNEAIASGQADISRTDVLFFRHTSTSYTVTITGGTFSATGNLQVTANGVVTNGGGRFLAEQNLTIQAPQISGAGLLEDVVYQDRRGIRDLFNAPNAQFLQREVGGSFISTGGTVNLLTPGPVIVAGGVVSGPLGVNVPGGLQITAPITQKPVADGPLGFLHGIFGF